MKEKYEVGILDDRVMEILEDKKNTILNFISVQIKVFSLFIHKNRLSIHHYRRLQVLKNIALNIDLYIRNFRVG